MTRVYLIHAGPTPWDLEDRVVGNTSLPLDDDAAEQVRQIIVTIPQAVSTVYRDKRNEAADTVGKIVARHFKLRPRHNEDLGGLGLGLWQGSRREELRFRFPSVFPAWEKDPLAVNAPEGEPLGDAVARIERAVKKILRQHRGMTVAIVLPPKALQIAAGLLRGEDVPRIASHLHNVSALETIELSEGAVMKLLS